MGYHGLSHIFIKDQSSFLLKDAIKISEGLKLIPMSIYELYLKSSNTSLEDTYILDYDYENVTKVLDIDRTISKNQLIKFTYHTNDSKYEKDNMNIVSEDQNIIMSDETNKLASELKIGDKIKGVCGFTSEIIAISYLDTQPTYLYNIKTESGTFYIHGMIGN